MSTKQMPWFRMYTDAVDDEKLRLIAPSDRWYFFAILCCKGKGIVDEAGPLLKRKVAVKLGLQVDELEEVARRLAEVGLIDRDSFQPLGWEDRQFKGDADVTAAERKRRQRERERLSVAPADEPNDGHGHVTRDINRDTERDVTNVTRTDTEADTEADTDTETEEEQKDIPHTRRRGASVCDASSGSDGDDVGKPLREKRLVAEGVDRQHAKDWLTIRKAKRLPLTPTAWGDVKHEAGKAGLTPAQAVECAVKAGWAGFKASWMGGDGHGVVLPAASRSLNRQEALEARNRETAARAAAEIRESMQ